MSRKTKFSNNWKKAKARVQRIHSRIGNARRDYLHKTHDHDQPKPRDGVYRGLAGAEYVQVGGRYNREAGQKRSGQVRPEQSHPRSGLVRVPPPTGLQAGVERRLSHRRAAAEHEPDVSGVRPCVGGQPPDAGKRFACVECGFEETPILVGAINVLRAGHARLRL
jgi:putative transposase